MVYKKYVKKGDKLLGPYYYESYRENGTVKKRYLGTSIPRKSNLFLMIFSVFLVLSLVGAFYGYQTLTGKVIFSEVISIVDQVTSDSDLAIGLQDDVAVSEDGDLGLEDVEQNIPVDSESDEIGNDSSDSESNSENIELNDISSEENESIEESDIALVNESVLDDAVNESEDILVNESIVNDSIANESIVEDLIVNDSQINESIINESVLDDAVNGSIVNDSIINDSIQNLSFLKDIEIIRVSKNSEAYIDLEEYFSGAESYELDARNLSYSINESILTLIPDLEFKGAIRAKVIAYLLNDSLESNEFMILVSGANISVVSSRSKIVLGEPVKWIQNVSLDTPDNVTLELPKEAENISVKKIEAGEELVADVTIRGITGNVVLDVELREEPLIKRFFKNLFRTITGKAIFDVSEQNSSIEVALEDDSLEYSVEYYTDAPISIEQNNSDGKTVIISGPDELNYTDVLAYTDLEEVLKVGQENEIQIYWYENQTYLPFEAYDLNGNDYLDYLEWNVPHLSNQTFRIILISDAIHLDSNREFIENVYDYVKGLDGNFTQIPVGDYIRIRFEHNLTSDRDITVYGKSNFSNVSLEVYEHNGSEVLAGFGNIFENGKYQIFLNNLSHSQDVFDLRVIGEENGSIEFDLIIDPQEDPNFTSDLCDPNGWCSFRGWNNRTGDMGGGRYAPVIGNVNVTNFSTGFSIQSSPAIANGYVYIQNSNGTLYQLNASNVSHQIHNFSLTGGALWVGGSSYSSPAIANGYLYVGSTNGRLFQLNASNISNHFANFSTGGTIYSSPAIANGYVYVGNFNGLDNRLYQLNASNVSQHIANFSIAAGINRVAPAIANGYVYIGGVDDRLYQLNASNISNHIANFSTGGAIYASPAIANGYLYIGSYGSIVYQLNASNISNHIANFSAGLTESSPAIANGYLYIGSFDNRVYQLNASNISNHIANFSTSSNITSSPAIANGYLYIGSFDNRVYQLNASNISNHIANFSTGSPILSSPTVSNSYVYIGSNDGNLYQIGNHLVSGSESDTTSPVVNLVHPGNGSLTTNPVNYFYANFTDDTLLKNATLYLWNSTRNLIGTNSTNIAGTSNSSNLTILLPYSGNFTWNYIVWDNSSNFAWNATNFSIQYTPLDTTSPVANLIFPGNGTTVVNNVVYFHANFTDETLLKNVTLEVWNSTGSLLFTNSTNITGTSNSSNLSIVLPYSGFFLWNYLVWDNSSNMGRNVTNFTVTYTPDVIAPLVTIASPTNQTYTTDSYSINIRLNEGGFCQYSLNGGTTNSSLTANSTNSGFTGSLSGVSNAGYTLRAYCNDSSGNRNDTEFVNFGVNVEASEGSSGSSGGGGGGGGGGSSGNKNNTQISEDQCDTSIWSCPEWSDVLCTDNQKQRTCTNVCSNATNIETRLCNSNCNENWQCEDWSVCVNGVQTRSCSDANSCDSNFERPQLTRSCVLSCVPNWQCDSWSVCQNGFVSRSCRDLNRCGSEEGKPDTSRNCYREGCSPGYICEDWGECTYTKKIDQVFSGVQTMYGLRERICEDYNECIATPKEYEFCRSIVRIKLVETDICGDKTLQAVNYETGSPIVDINLDTWKEDRLDIRFVQGAEICTTCYDGLKNADEEGIDCGGSVCKKCGGFLNWRWKIALLLVIMNLSLLGRIWFLTYHKKKSTLEEIREWISKGNESLSSQDNLRAKAIYEIIRSIYENLSDKNKKVIEKEIHDYYKKLHEKIST